MAGVNQSQAIGIDQQQPAGVQSTLVCNEYLSTITDDGMLIISI